ncbi:MAG: hypothetical protein CMJ18_25295 [Phycisphaeraceae bacterium]|nr:hypothetical protein [Phycisphaeraceae bacterium]
MLLIVAVAASAPAAELPRAVGQWRLDGDVEDASGRGHAGVASGATYVPRGDGRALRLDPDDGSVRIAAHADLDISGQGALEMWCRPQSRHGALFSWGREGEAGNRRFVLVFDTRLDWGEPGGELRLWAGGARRYQTWSTELPDLALDRWTHVVVCIDGKSLSFYYNYVVHYADEETSRWVAHLYRHYGIEGSTRPAATDPFDSSHLLADGDFADASSRWRLQPAAADHMKIVDEIHFGWLQGRFPYTPRGDSALRMVRSADGPNVAAQTLRNLRPGRLYVARMISAVHGDMSAREPHVLRLDVRGARMLPESSFARRFGNSYAHSYGDYDTSHRAWMTYHWVLFRAEATKAELVISDWADETRPGGPIGEPIILNFVQVHPYFDLSGEGPAHPDPSDAHD